MRSLILAEKSESDAAPFLFSDEDLPRIDKAKPRFNCNGERLFRDRPDVYKAVVRRLAEPGCTILGICEDLHVTDNVVRSVRDREQIPIALDKKIVLRNIAHGLRLASERVIALMPEASARDAIIGTGVLCDKFALLSGEVTARIELVEGSGNIFDRMKQLRDELVSHITLIEPAMGLGGENARPKALPGLKAAVEAAVDGELVEQ